MEVEEHGHDGFTRRCSARIEHVLRVIAQSPYGKSLVLRGSMLLSAWLGPAARLPHDLDWVVEPASLSASSAEAIAMLQDLVARIQTAEISPNSGPVFRLSSDEVHIDAIWTYERAEGRRVVLPWQTTGIPPGTVQLDFVFQEVLPTPAIELEVPSRITPNESIAVRGASPELSLAWKILWLASDMHPQGKDLYDATLLAERYSVSRALVEEVLRSAQQSAITVEPNMPMDWNVEWQHLLAEYPNVQGDVLSWKTRLSNALARSFLAG